MSDENTTPEPSGNLGEPQPLQRKNGGNKKPGLLTGRGLTIVLGIIAGVVIVGGLLIIIFSGSGKRIGEESSQTIDSANPSATHPDGLTITAGDGTSMRVRLGSVPMQVFLDGQAEQEFPGALTALPSYLDLRSPIYTIESQGNGPVTVDIVIPNAAEPYQTLDLYQWDADAGEWRFVPGHVDVADGVIRTNVLPPNVAIFQTSRLTPQISTMLEAGQSLNESSSAALNLVMPTGYELGPDGGIHGAPVAGWLPGAGYAVAPVIRATDGSLLSVLLNNQSSVAVHVEDLKNLVNGAGYNGITIDYQNLSPDDEAVFSQFVSDLAVALHSVNKILVVRVPTPTGGPGQWDTGAYDWRAIGASADIVVVPGGPAPSDYTINGQAVDLLVWSVGEISRYKLQLGLPSYSYDETNQALISYADALAALGDVNVQPGSDGITPGTDLSFALNGGPADVVADQTTGAYVYTADTGGSSRRIWLVTANVMRSRLDLAANFNLGGMSIDGLGAPGSDQGLPQALSEFKVQVASTVPGQVVMQWTLSDASGALLTENTGLGTPWLWQAGSPGDYTVSGAVVGSGASDRGGVAVHVVAEATATPTPTPTPTYVPQPQPHPTSSGGATATQAPAPTAAATAVPPSSGSANVGGFELGGQTDQAGGYQVNRADLMNQAGMTWVKFQIKWSPGMDPSVAATPISVGHNAGFKVLLSITGTDHPTSIDYTGYVNFLSGVAGYGPDAIEVWNEENIDREWPNGQVNGANYVNNMLAPAYQAIKAANSGVMVISGAPSPTGYWGGCANEGCDDWIFIQQMRDAGAANYFDCMGIHFNSGATSPNDTTGHPADAGDHHYTWYYKKMVDLYYGTFGEVLCFTELGIVSPDGLGPLPSAFSWGSGTTAAEQAQWLSEAAVLAAQSGKVRLMVIFNVDFTEYAGDPQAGYAILRPGGSCPACAALGSVMH